MCFFDIDFFAFFWIFSDFGSILGGQKSLKNRKKSNKIAKIRKKVDFGTGTVWREASGRVLEGFGAGFSTGLEGFGVVFERVLGKVWEDF